MVERGQGKEGKGVAAIAKGLSEAQRAALLQIRHLGNNPYGWEAGTFARSGAVAGALERCGLLMGGHIYGARVRSYRYTELGQSVADYLRSLANDA
jgi:hypothetical protein